MKNSHSYKVIIGVALSVILLIGCKEKNASSQDVSIPQNVYSLPAFVPEISIQGFLTYKE